MLGLAFRQISLVYEFGDDSVSTNYEIIETLRGRRGRGVSFLEEIEATTVLAPFAKGDKPLHGTLVRS